MKVQNFKRLLFVSSILSIALLGCLKDDAYDNQEIQSTRPDGAQNTVFVGLTATSNDNHLQLAFEKSDADTTFDAVPVLLAGDAASEDVQVTLSYNPALLGSYNADNGTTHEEAPTDLYT